jgi:hypothetical protein
MDGTSRRVCFYIASVWKGFNALRPPRPPGMWSPSVLEPAVSLSLAGSLPLEGSVPLPSIVSMPMSRGSRSWTGAAMRARRWASLRPVDETVAEILLASSIGVWDAIPIRH